MSRIIVVDLDRKSRADGIANFRSLCKTLGIKVPGTYKVQTPNGGRHLYFFTKHAAEIRNSAGILGPGIDIRGSGGCAVGEYSEINGIRYARISGHLDEIATLPANLRKAIQDAEPKKR